MPKVFTIILNWNGLKDTLECLDSVYRLDYHNFKVIVVDNCSTDDSVKIIRTTHPQVILLENSRNLGYTGGNNIGIRYAMNHGADYVWLLNNDTIVDPDSLSKLVNEAEKSPEIGLVSPVVCYFDNPEMVQYIGASLDFSTYSVIPVRNPAELDADRIRRHLVLYGTALLIGSNVIEVIGYLPDKYFAYQEDFAYSFRALSENFQTRVRLDARILHKEAQTTGKGSPLHIFLMTRNEYFLWMDNEKGFRKVFVPCHYISKIIHYAKYLSDEGNETGFDACLEGGWAAFIGKGGAYDKTFLIPPWFKICIRFFISWHPYFWIRLFKGNVRDIVRESLARA